MSSRSTRVAEALYDFFSGFGIPAYAIGTVPKDVRAPYLVYDLVVPDLLQSMPFYAEVYYRSPRLDALNAKVDEIETAIGEGVSLPTGAGCVRVYRGARFRQNRVFPGDPLYRVAYLNLIIAADTT